MCLCQASNEADENIFFILSGNILHFVLPLRNRTSLRLLSAWCRPTTSKGQRLCRAVKVPPLSQPAATAFLAAHGSSLVWVRLSLLSKGKPETHAMVCVPTAEDLKLLGRNPVGGDPQEPPHRDHFACRMKGHKKGSKKTSTCSLSADDPEGKNMSAAVTAPASSSDLVFGLWPDPLPSVTSHCSRVTLGWVTQGDFSLFAGCGEALGFVSVTGLLHTLLHQAEEHRGTLLLRNPNSLHYRLTKANIEV